MLHQHDGTHDGFASQLLAVGQGLRGELALGLLPALLIEASSKHAILGGFTPACVLLRLYPALVWRHAFAIFLALGCFF
jgi:hypothetical protein